MTQQELITETKSIEKKSDNKLAIIVKESGLVAEKAKVLLSNFSNYFDIAAEWEKKARMIVVTDASQLADMKMARTGRLFLREKRIAIEHTRKELKEQSLREGKAIDGIANVLKALIVPIEEYLEKQEKFIEIKAAEEAEKKRIEAEKKAEKERIAKEKAEAEERARIRQENERLKKEAEEKERRLAEERARAEAERKKREAEQKAHEERLRKQQEEAERKAREEQERQTKILADQKAKAEAERQRIQAEKEAAEKKAREEKEHQAKIIAQQKARAEAERKKAEKEREEARRLKECLADMIECPFCHKKFRLEDVNK